MNVKPVCALLCIAFPLLSAQAQSPPGPADTRAAPDYGLTVFSPPQAPLL
jgi:hypothetical protein